MMLFYIFSFIAIAFCAYSYYRRTPFTGFELLAVSAVFSSSLLFFAVQYTCTTAAPCLSVYPNSFVSFLLAAFSVPPLVIHFVNTYRTPTIRSYAVVVGVLSGLVFSGVLANTVNFLTLGLSQNLSSPSWFGAVLLVCSTIAVVLLRYVSTWLLSFALIVFAAMLWIFSLVLYPDSLSMLLVFIVVNLLAHVGVMWVLPTRAAVNSPKYRVLHVD